MDKITNEILGIMIKHNGDDVIRINHAIKVFAFAQYIGVKENCSLKEQSIIEYSSILHDIGIHEAEKNIILVLENIKRNWGLMLQEI